MCRWVGGSRTFPSVDANQDLTMTMAEEVNGWTTVSFTRARTTGDPSPTDVSLENAVFLLWASGDEQNFNADQPESIIYHGSNRGVSDQEISICAGENKCLPSLAYTVVLTCVYACMNVCLHECMLACLYVCA